jgi:hypothetical protein
MNPALQVQNGGGRLLAGLHPGLMVGIDVDQGAIETNSPFIESDESPYSAWIHSGNGDGNGIPLIFIEGLPCSQQKAGEKVSRGGPCFHVDRFTLPLLQHLNEGGKEVGDSLAKLLHIGVLVGGTLVAIDSDALMNKIAGKIFSFPSDSITNCWR